MILVDAYLPSKKSCSLEFLQDLAEGKKKYLVRSKVPTFQIPSWPELGVGHHLEQVLADPVLKDYFPDRYRKGKVPEKTYFWGVIFACKPEFAKAVLKEAMELRNQLPEDGKPDHVKCLAITAPLLQ